MNVADRVQIDQIALGENQEEWKSMTNDKNVSYVVDQQNGNYSNQVSFDLSSVVSQDSFLALQESYGLLPMASVVSIPSGSSVTALTNIAAENLCPKSNFINSVDSIQLFVNGQQLIDQTSMSNIPLNLMDMMIMSQDDLKVRGSALNIVPDTTSSIRFSNAATAGGDGYLNNQFLPKTSAATLTDANVNVFNDGLAKRNSLFLTPGAVGTTTSGCPPAFSSDSGFGRYSQILQPYFSVNTGTVVEAAWNYVVYLPFARLSNLLEKYPMVKSASQVRLVINFNAGTTLINCPTTTTMKFTSYTSTGGSTNQVMFNNALINAVVFTGATSTTGNIQINTRIQTTVVSVSASAAQKGFVNLPQCRAYVPTYKINAEIERIKIIPNAIQTIRYLDWYQQPILNVQNNTGYSQVLTTALANVQVLIMVPFHNGATTNVPKLFTSVAGSQFQSPFDSAPATSLPGGMLAFQNFNVSVSGINQFNQNCNFNYDIWQQEVQKLGLNGGLSKEITSGLWDLATWNWSPFAVCDISRRSEKADSTYQSVVVSGTNNTGFAVDYYCFIGFQKEIRVNVLTGAVEKVF